MDKSEWLIGGPVLVALGTLLKIVFDYLRDRSKSKLEAETARTAKNQQLQDALLEKYEKLLDAKDKSYQAELERIRTENKETIARLMTANDRLEAGAKQYNSDYVAILIKNSVLTAELDRMRRIHGEPELAHEPTGS